MTTLLRIANRMLRPLPLYVFMALLTCGLSSCAAWRVRDEGLRENELSKTAQRARSDKADASADIDYWSFSKKGRQVERDLSPL